MSHRIRKLLVANRGEPIPLAKRARLFHPFTRSGDDKVHQGLGLGLYIAAEIAKAHGGEI
jgi:signal transduction histidine kinase